ASFGERARAVVRRGARGGSLLVGLRRGGAGRRDAEPRGREGKEEDLRHRAVSAHRFDDTSASWVCERRRAPPRDARNFSESTMCTTVRARKPWRRVWEGLRALSRTSKNG